MRIETLHLKDFRSHQDTKLDLDRFVFVVGANAVGKTSLAAAIQFLLTGKCQFTDERGGGADDLIRLGARETYVAGRIGKTLIERSKSPKGHTVDLAGKSGPLSAMQDKIYEGLGVSADVVAACLNSSRFLAMDEKSQKALLAQVLASEGAKATDEIQADVAAIMGMPPGGAPQSMTVADIDGLYKLFFDERTQTNRDIKALGTVEAPAEQEGAPDYKATWKRLDDLRNELTRVTAERARTEERYESALRSAADRRADLTRRQAEARGRQLTEAEAEKWNKVLDAAEKGTALATKMDSLVRAIAEKLSVVAQDKATKRATLIAQRDSLKAQLAEKEDRAQRLIKIKSADCPTCARALSPKDKAALGLLLDDEATKLRKEIDGIGQDLVKVVDSPDETQEIANLRKDFKKAEAEYAAIGDVRTAESKLRVHREAIVEADRCGRELKAVVDPEKPDLASLTETIKELNARIGKGEAVLAQVSELDRAKSAFETWKQKKHEFEERLERLARLLDFFGPNGIKAAMVGDKIGPFTIAMNETLNQFGYVANFTLDPYAFNVAESSGGPRRTLRQLSESEGFRFSIAFQIALAMATGLKLVIIDRADVLDAHSRGILTSMLMESGLDQAIVLSTTDKPAPEELPEGVRFVVLGEKAAVAA